MKSKFIFFTLLLFTCCQLHGQSYHYTYNSTGGCTSRIFLTSQDEQKFSKRLKVTVTPVPKFSDHISISVSGLNANETLNYTMTDTPGRVVLKGSIKRDGYYIISTANIPKIIVTGYLLRINGRKFNESYKLIKE